MPTPIFYRIREERRERMLNQAIGAFSDNVYEDVSIRNIIKAMDITTGSFYRYFGSKEQLYIFLVDEMLVRFWSDIHVDINDVNSHVSINDIDRLLPAQSNFWRFFFRSTPEIRRKYYFRVQNNRLYDRYLSGVQRLPEARGYDPQVIGMTAFLLNLLAYIIASYQEIIGQDEPETDLFPLMRDMILTGFIHLSKNKTPAPPQPPQ